MISDTRPSQDLGFLPQRIEVICTGRKAERMDWLLVPPLAWTLGSDVLEPKLTLKSVYGVSMNALPKVIVKIALLENLSAIILSFGCVLDFDF